MIIYPNKGVSQYLGKYLLVPCAISLADVTVEQAAFPIKDLGLSDETMATLDVYGIEYVGQFNQEVTRLPGLKMQSIIEVSKAIKGMLHETAHKELALV